ncbi:MAG: U32 family peptidase [Anaerorhabdus sp.]
MRKIECLAPAGTMDALRAAIYAGADAIYCGGSQYGARAFAGNFNHDEMIEAVRLCHLWGTKIYVTMNTLIYEDEFKSAMQEVNFYYTIGVDALIIQDFGLFDKIRQDYPDFELHCSTQMHIHNSKGVEVMKELGASRVVLARETPINIIEECCKLGIEIEVFSYGALCVSYSGQCLMSSLLSHRSGNRGACAQYCRMQYDLINETTNTLYKSAGKYLLSPKDLNIIDQLPQLIKCGVSSLKIEGRMKRPEYVYLVTKIFREAIDAYYDNKEYNLSLEHLNNLKLMFNRGFTLGHLFNTNGNALMNTLRPNHMGLPLGKVVEANRDEFSILLDSDLNQHDGLRILDDKEDLGLIANKIIVNGRLVNHALKGELVTFKDSRYVKVGSQVVKTTDSKLMNELETFPILRKVSCSIYVQAKVNEPLYLKISVENHTVDGYSSDICQMPLKAPIDKDRLFEQLLKLNDTVYTCDDIKGDLEPFFMPLKQINELRRQLIEKLNSYRTAHIERTTKPYKLNDRSFQLEGNGWVEVNSINQIDISKELNLPLCSSNPIILNNNLDILALAPIVNEKSIYCDDRPLIVTEIGGLTTPNKCYASHHFNVTNSYALAFLYKMGISFVELSQECDFDQINDLVQAFTIREGIQPNIGVFHYGRRDLMTSKTCVINNLCKDGSKKNCSACKENSYSLIDLKKNHYPCFGDAYCIQHILENEPYFFDTNIMINKIIRFTIEDYSEIQTILKKI